MEWKRKNGEIVKVDDYDLFQNGAWIPNAIKFYLAKWFPSLLPEYEQQRAEEIENQPDYDSLLRNVDNKVNRTDSIRMIRQL